METKLTLVPSKPKAWLLLFVWGFLILFAGKFILHDALPYFGFEESFFGEYWAMKWPLIGHISGGAHRSHLRPLSILESF